VRTHRRSTLRLPPDRQATPRPIAEGERLDLLNRFLLEESIDLGDRVAGCLVVLYALPVSRINRLRTDDFAPVDGGLALRISDNLVPVPTPLAGLIGQLEKRRRNVTGAGHPESDWLFPGRLAANPSNPISSPCGSTATVSRERHGPPPSTRYSRQCPPRFWPSFSTASHGAWLNEAKSSGQTGGDTSLYEYSRDQIRGLHTKSIMRLRQSSLSVSAVVLCQPIPDGRPCHCATVGMEK
jgi:hypothetical protein